MTPPQLIRSRYGTGRGRAASNSPPSPSGASRREQGAVATGDGLHAIRAGGEDKQPAVMHAKQGERIAAPSRRQLGQGVIVFDPVKHRPAPSRSGVVPAQRVRAGEWEAT